MITSFYELKQELRDIWRDLGKLKMFLDNHDKNKEEVETEVNGIPYHGGFMFKSNDEPMFFIGTFDIYVNGVFDRTVESHHTSYSVSDNDIVEFCKGITEFKRPNGPFRFSSIKKVIRFGNVEWVRPVFLFTGTSSNPGIPEGFDPNAGTPNLKNVIEVEEDKFGIGMFQYATTSGIDVSNWCFPLIDKKPPLFDQNADFEGQYELQPGWGPNCEKTV